MSNLTRRQFIQTTTSGAAALALSRHASPSPFTQNPENKHMIPELPFRQIHLDFHTSEHIKGIGSEFDPDEFADTLKKAHVNSVTCFGRCHHGYIYYDTKLFTERHHPHLQRNLLAEQIEACHKRGIRVPIYITIQWDHYTARQHPDWLIMDGQGKPIGTPVFKAGFYRFMCVNSPYRDFLKKHLKELFETVPVDGLFLDIVQTRPCACNYCKAKMVAANLQPANAEHRLKYADQMMTEYKAETTEFIRTMDKDCTIFYNAGHLGPAIRTSADSYSHFELESLPSGHWGYLHFPLTVRFVRGLGKDFMGMTGKFHTSWGDFHSFKNEAALQFECFSMIAHGAKCSVGDQLHPSGKIDRYTYELIGSVYSEVEKKEPWCHNAKPVTEIAVLSPEEFVGGRLPDAAMGAVRILQEGAQQFDIVDSQSDYSAYKMLILPDVIKPDPALTKKLSVFIANGGSVLASYESGLKPDGAEFAIPDFGVRKTGDGPVDLAGEPVRGRAIDRHDYVQYIIPKAGIGLGLNPTEYAMYIRGLDVSATGSAKILAAVTTSYFDRTYEHFCSHRQTPSSGKQGAAAIVQNGNVIYFSHPVFTQYNKNAPRWCKILVLNAINILLPNPMLLIDGPSSLVTTLAEQTAEKRRVLHLLHYIPERRGKDFDVIEDVIPIYNIKVSIRDDVGIKTVTTQPEGEPISFKINTGRVEFELSILEGHQMIELAYG